MDCNAPGLPVRHQIPEFTQTHNHWVGDAVQPSHPLSSPSPPAFNLSQHQGFFQWVRSSHQVARVLEFHLQHQSFQWIFRTDFLQDGLVGFPFCPKDSQESSPTPQFKSINSSALSLFMVQLSHPYMTTGSESCSVMFDFLWPHGLYSPWNSPSQNTGVGSPSLLQGIFTTQGSNPGLWHCRQILYQLSHKDYWKNHSFD